MDLGTADPAALAVDPTMVAVAQATMRALESRGLLDGDGASAMRSEGEPASSAMERYTLGMAELVLAVGGGAYWTVSVCATGAVAGPGGCVGAIVIGAALGAALSSADAAEVESIIALNVRAADAVGVTVDVGAEAGSTLVIRAGGSWAWCPVSDCDVDPSGDRLNGGGPEECGTSDCVVASTNLGALIGASGSGGWAYVGFGQDTTVDAAGPVILMANDIIGTCSDNSGALRVTVARR